MSISDRIRARLEQLNLKQEDLVERVNKSGVLSFDKTKLSKSLSGKRNFTSSEIAVIADFLSLDAYYLITGEHADYEPKIAARHNFKDQEHSVDWEALNRQIRNVADAYTQVNLEGNGVLENVRRALRAPSGNQVDYVTGRKLAVEMRKLWVASDCSDIVLDLPQFLENHMGIDLVVVDGVETNRAQANSFQVAGNSVIVVVQTGSWYSAVFATIHEVAHLLFDDHFQHDITLEPNRGDSEAYANGFAADFLLPFDTFTDFQSPTLKNVALAAWHAGVGAKTISNRSASTNKPLTLTFSQLELDAEFELQFGFDAVNERRAAWRSARFPERLIQAHRNAVTGGETTPGYLAWMLGVPEEELWNEPEVDLKKAASELLAHL